MMRVGLNLLHALPEIGGGWNYIASLVSALGECDDINTYVVFVNRESERLLPPKPNFIPVCVNIRSTSRLQRVLYENTLLHLLARRYELDCMHWLSNTQALVNAVPGAVTIYDMQPFLNLAGYSFIKRLYLHFMVSQTVPRARVLLPISQSTLQDLRRLFPSTLPPMIVIPPILNPQFKPRTTEENTGFKNRYGLPDQFWLYVAHFYPHKNHIRLFEAYRQLKAKGFVPWPLVLRGDASGTACTVAEAVRRLSLENDVVFLPRLSDSEMSILYSASTALVFPSLYEGGGIPVIEAMACGCPVIASDIPPAREFAGEAGYYFDSRDADSIGRAMMEFQLDLGQQERQRQTGLARATEFSPQSVVSKLLSAYSQAAKK